MRARRCGVVWTRGALRVRTDFIFALRATRTPAGGDAVQSEFHRPKTMAQDRCRTLPLAVLHNDGGCSMSPFATVDEYIAAQPPDAQARLLELRAVVREAVPDATEVISYGMPTYTLSGRRVHFAAAK